MDIHYPAFRISTFLALLVTQAVVSRGLAQSQPPSLSQAITGASELSEIQIVRVSQYAEYWCNQLKASESTTAQVEIARRELMRPLISGGRPTPAFRFKYGSLIVPEMEPIIEADGNPHNAFNATVVLGELATRRSLELLIRHADSRNETRREIRIPSAMNAAKTLSKFGNDVNVFKPRDLGVALRGLRNAAQREDDPIVLRHLLEGILSIDSPDSRDAMILALRVIMDNIQQYDGGLSPLIEPVYIAIADLRNVLIVNRGEAARIGPVLGPELGKFLQYMNEKWDFIHADPTLVEDTKGPISACEGLLKIIVGALNIAPTGTKLRQNWVDPTGKQEFSDEVGQWSTLLRKPRFGR